MQATWWGQDLGFCPEEPNTAFNWSTEGCISLSVCTLPPSSLPEVSASYAVRHQLTFQGGLVDLSNVFTRTGQGELDLHV